MTTTSTVYTEETDPFCLPEPVLVELLADVPYRRFAVCGDSLSRGTGDPTPGYRDLGWSDRVGGLLRTAHPDAAYLNTAVVGATTGQALREQVEDIVAFAPDLLLVPSGANDIMRPTPDFAAVEQTLRRMWDIAAGTGARLLVFTFGRAFVVPAFDDWHDRITRLNELTRTLAAEHGALLLDWWPHPVNDRENLLSPDRIHWSTSGQAVMATGVVQALAADVRSPAA
ncbi:MAG: hypothetical protein AVDCRST_MAG66-1682 [uncultured Pseudonocardia sp.]|uniref:SGNH hydrolase-type esterase domain-containing protein n=1 Tax=uncultured Pseudonocardia sp. TaxID=211455 RepID=A0A6J4P481_9PSEU|nr:MAG: hypothetical protein AVDCRST_MAG66-1682 [uncultured Pseudonocardia sp.]